MQFGSVLHNSVRSWWYPAEAFSLTHFYLAKYLFSFPFDFVDLLAELRNISFLLPVLSLEGAQFGVIGH